MLSAKMSSVLCVCAVLAVAGMPQSVVAQGYQGLVADDPATTGTAPQPRARPSARTAPSGEAPGYQGLIPGAAAPVAPSARSVVPAPNKAQPETTPPTDTTRARPVRPPAASASAPAQTQPAALGVTPIPGRGVQPIRSTEDLLRVAAMHRVDPSFEGIPADMAAQFRMPESAIEMLKQPQPRINGMLPMENHIKTSIDRALASLNEPGMTPQAREARRQQTLQSLRTMHSGIKAKMNIPDQTYQMMGMPATYIKEDRAANRNTLARIEAALKQVEQR